MSAVIQYQSSENRLSKNVVLCLPKLNVLVISAILSTVNP